NGDLVLLLIFFGQVPPVPECVTNENINRRYHRLFHRRDRSGRGSDAAKLEPGNYLPFLTPGSVTSPVVNLCHRSLHKGSPLLRVSHWSHNVKQDLRSPP